MQMILPGVEIADDNPFDIPHRPLEVGPDDRVTGAIFSPGRMYRYLLWRSWSTLVDDGITAEGFTPDWKRWILFLMLNPSTADESTNDPTVERCERRAKEYGYCGLIVANLFAYRATNPNKLYDKSVMPRGARNDEAILYAAQKAELIVCAWGAHGRLYDRGSKTLAMLREKGVTPHCLRLVDVDVPEHPLYIPYTMRPVTFDVAPRGLRRGVARKANGNG